jgi:hypothetical protein
VLCGTNSVSFIEQFIFEVKYFIIASPRRLVSYSGFGATLQLPTNGSKLQSWSASGIGYGAHIEVSGQGNILNELSSISS